MSTKYPQRLAILLLMCLFLACAKKEPLEAILAPNPVAPVAPTAPVAPSTPEVKQTAGAPEATVKTPAGLAVLAKLKNRADMREHDETVWQTAVTGIGFFKHDALQTHEGATAFVRYESGSNLDLRENTLVIFDKDPGIAGKSHDRVLLKNGALVGATKKELWVFTNAGLVQIKPLKKNQTAQTTLSVDTEKKLVVAVKTGTAEVIVKKDGKEFQKFSMAENSDFEFKPKAEFDVASDSAAVPVVKNNSLADLVIEAPLDDTVSTSGQFEVKGKLTEMGAKLLLNGQLVEINDDLNFKQTTTLTEGTNLLVFQLVRSDSSVKFYRKTIRYNKSK